MAYNIIDTGNYVRDRVVGMGVLQAVPEGDLNGQPLEEIAPGAEFVRFYLGAEDSISFAIEAEQPTTEPENFVTINGSDSPVHDEPIGAGIAIYIIATTGTPKYRYV